MWNTNVTYTRIKLCWFEYLEAAYEASTIGADALGFHILQDLNKSDWRRKMERFKGFIDVLPPGIEKTLLIDFPYETVLEVLNNVPFESVQLYPDWEPHEIDSLREAVRRPLTILKVMSAKPEENHPPDDDRFLERYAHHVDAMLLDSSRRGGTGELGSIEHYQDIVRKSPVPVFFAGGLNAENVGHVIRTVRPFGVDVESGVSDKIREGWLIKNMRKCREFVEAVARADRELLREQAKT